MINGTGKRLVIAHRGERLLAPENTIRGCELALEMGASGLEVDIQLCKSGELVLLHDHSLRRCFARSGSVTSLTLHELKGLSFNSRQFQYPDSICTLEEFLEHFRGRVPINLDLKSLRPTNVAYVAALKKLVERMNVAHQVWFSSFNPLVLRHLKSAAPDVRTGYLFQNPSFVHSYIDSFLDTDAWHPHFKNFNDRLYENAKRMRKEIYVWTVNRKDILESLQGYEIDGIITDTFFRG
ncbi:MAG: glycerophosphodiester phosphodiesterase [Calditrichia bacterium]